MAMMRLNPQVRQFDGFAPGRRVFGRKPKMAIGAVSNPHFEDFTHPVVEPATKTHHLSAIIRQVRKASRNADFSGRLNLTSNKRIRGSKMKNSFYARLFPRCDKSEKGEIRRLGRGIITGCFGGKYALVRFRGAYLEVDLDDMRPTSRLQGVLGRGGGAAATFTKYKVTNTLFSWPTGANFPFKNEKLDFEP